MIIVKYKERILKFIENLKSKYRDKSTRYRQAPAGKWQSLQTGAGWKFTMVNKIFILLLLISLTGCDLQYFFFPRHPVIEPITNNTNRIRLDGYYYCLKHYNYKEGKADVKYSYAFSFIPYNNGCFFGVGCGDRLLYKMDSISMIKTLDYSTKEMSMNKGYQSSHTCWGAYYFKNDTIVLKREGGRLGEALYTDIGVIINDTTFEIKQKITTGSMVDDENKIENVSMIYHFREFYPKPDSTNSIIITKHNK